MRTWSSWPATSRGRPEAVAWASKLGKPVLYVLGNHEFYGGSIATTAARFKALAAGTDVRLLDDESVVIGNVRFLGSTLWTDFMLFGEGEQRDAAMADAVRFMRDYSRIRTGDDAAGRAAPRGHGRACSSGTRPGWPASWPGRTTARRW